MRNFTTSFTGAIILTLLLLPNVFYAQLYHGGNGDGNAVAIAYTLPLGRNIYLGGIDDGESLSQSNMLALGRNIYLGGIDDGEGLGIANMPVLGRNIYFGGIDDGEALGQANTPTLGRNIFYGGVDDGEALGNALTQPLGRNIFYGGADDGWAMAFITNLKLPITLKDFAGQWQQSNALLNWQTTTESNSSHFELKRSFDAQNFTAIASINAAGQSNSLINYVYTDVNVKALLPPGSQAVYYRLKSVDKDGKFTYSGIVVLKTEVTGVEYAIFPNPASQYINITASNLLPNTTNYVRLADVGGKIIMLQKMTSSTMQLNVSNLVTGTYFLQILSGNKAAYTQKIIIQK